MIDNEYPKLRYVDAFPVETAQGRMFGLRDPNGIASNMLFLSPDIFYLLQFFDGRHSQLDLRHKYLQAFGNLLYEEQLAEILTNLDSNLYLDNHAFQRSLREIERQFLSLPARVAAHAGQSYESEPAKLKAQIRSFFTNAVGAGLPTKRGHKVVKGIIAPHIDLRAGGACYSFAYRGLAESQPADCFVILGTGHSGLANLYSILAKDFETPLGRAQCDFDFIETLNSKTRNLHSAEVLPHRSEHTIEFQLPFLQYLFEKKHHFTFVPILCSFSYHMLNPEQFPRERKIVDDFSGALRETIAQFGKRVCLIASVDFSHVGQRYGDERPPDLDFLAAVRAADQELIAHVERVDHEGFYRVVEKYCDRHRVCGFSPIYTMLRSLTAQEGKLLNYSETAMDESNSTVTFASMVFS
ncbi:MAG TPA: AmmeMemoRadiSam system protein B [bacterium]